MLKRLIRSLAPNPLDRLLSKASRHGQKKVLFFWNRGLGDIALGLFAIVHRVRAVIPDATITFLTRENLRDGFTLLGGCNVIVAPQLKRGEQPDIRALLVELGVDPEQFDLIIDRPDPTRWVPWQRGTLTPLLHWNSAWDDLWKSFGLDEKTKYIGAHVQTETSYAHWRNWPIPHWEELFAKLRENGEKILLFGFEKTPLFEGEGIIDLRGETDLFPLLSIIKHRCKAVILPDSGITSMTYYLADSFPITLLSLWADPNMGILKQRVSSPNPQLHHVPLLGEGKDLRNLSPGRVYEELC